MSNMSAVTLSATTSTALAACVAVVAFARFERAAVRKWLALLSSVDYGISLKLVLPGSGTDPCLSIG